MNNSKKGVITKVESGSIAEEIGLEVGDKIIEINGQSPEDLIDINFFLADEFVEIFVEKVDGEEWILEVEKEFHEDLGLSFEASTFDGIRSCQNKCVFCFVDQMPKGLRKSLYIKDDDYRMSFLHGNFVTFTNLKPENVERILRLRLSPIYISVHTTNGELRKEMLNNDKSDQILPLLRKLAEAELEMHTQIVLCPDINDGKELDKTIGDLAKLYPQVQSIAVVPVGLTKFRADLSPLKTFNKASALKVINQIEAYQKDFRKRFGNSLVFLADEFYLLAEQEVPKAKFYGDYPQLENGVGLVRLFLDTFDQHKNELPKSFNNKRKVTFVTGVSGAKVLESIVKELNEITNLEVSLEMIVNKFFGETVTVAGLISFEDIYEQLRGKKLEGEIFIPSVMLKADEDIFLDGRTIKELQEKLKISVKVIDVNKGAKGLITELKE